MRELKIFFGCIFPLAAELGFRDLIHTHTDTKKEPIYFRSVSAWRSRENSFVGDTGSSRFLQMFVNKDGNIVILDDGVGGIEIPIEHLIQAIIVLSIGVLVIVTNVIIIATFITAPGPREVLTYYLLSLSVADLLVGVLVVPLSVYPTLVHHWMYGDVLCKASGYLGAVLWTASIYTLMWMSVDRYVAVRKPIRYEVIQTRTRIQCWVAVSWISALMLCCPPMLGFRGAMYDKEAAVCLLEWNVMPAYAATLASLILGNYNNQIQFN